MCSNFDLLSGRAGEVVSYFDITRNLFKDWQDEKSFFPGYRIPIIGLAETAGKRLMIPARWGIIPNYYSDTEQQPQPFNARSDTVAKYDTFSESFEQRRCIIPLAGFYEWTRTTPKVRFRLAPTEGLYGVAAIYDMWGEGAERIISAAMVTVDANALIGTFHDRCPAILPPEQYAAWLDPNAEVDDLLGLLAPWPSERMTKTEAPRPKVQRSAARRTKADTPGLF